MDKELRCPNCGSAQESGFVGFYTGLWWHTKRLRGLARLGFIAIPQGRRLAGHWTSSGVVRMISGLHCPGCDTVVIIPPGQENF